MFETPAETKDSHSGDPDAGLPGRGKKPAATNKKPLLQTDLPKITIVTPSFNQCEFIGQTIESILSQQYPDLEYLVMDGGSTDGTVDILRAYEDRLQWVSEPDRGQSHAINKGLEKASGEVIGFLNSDDLYEPGALRAVGTWFRRNPEAMWATGYCRNIDADGDEIRRAVTMYKRLWLRINSYTILQVLNFISQPATFWRKDVLPEVGLFDEGLEYAMDYDYWLRIGRRYRLSVIPKTLARYRIHTRSKAGSSVNAQFDSELAIAKKHVQSKLLRTLHAAHRIGIIHLYRLLFAVLMA
jgi:glycosyltransferase involved in cell wall biosynthesis